MRFYRRSMMQRHSLLHLRQPDFLSMRLPVGRKQIVLIRSRPQQPEARNRPQQVQRQADRKPGKEHQKPGMICHFPC